MKRVKRVARFSVNERVLCYEPDLTKARVMYDAKILKVECPDMSKKKKAKEFHYLVHFQGWSSTWDRYVTEEFLLKVTSENKQLQKNLFKEAEQTIRGREIFILCFNPRRDAQFYVQKNISCTRYLLRSDSTCPCI